jgi:hypothetical protein
MNANQLRDALTNLSPGRMTLGELQSRIRDLLERHPELGDVIVKHMRSARPRMPLRQAVYKAVEEQLGRPPMGALEGARERLRLYQTNPGLLTQVVAEERRARLG